MRKNLAVIALLATSCSILPTEASTLIVTADHLVANVGTRVDLTGRPGTSWSTSSANGRLTPSYRGETCDLEILGPGAIQVDASLGSDHDTVTVVGVTPGLQIQKMTLDGAPLPNEATNTPEWGGLSTLAGVPVLINDADGWTRYWQGLAAYSAQVGHDDGRDFTLPKLPPVDFAKNTLFVDGVWAGMPSETAVISDVDLATGRVLLSQPFGGTKRLGPAVVVNYLLLYKLPKLPATATIDEGCSGPCHSPLPSPQPFAHISPAVLTVGQATTLPTSDAGVPLSWRLQPGEALAALDGARLTAKAPGGLQLTASEGGQDRAVVDAIVRGDELPLNAAAIPATKLDDVQVISSAADWERLWFPQGKPSAGPDHPAPLTPALPEVDFSTRCLVGASFPSSVRPVVTSIDGTTVHLTVPRVGGLDGVQTTYFYDLPKFAGTPTMQLEN